MPTPIITAVKEGKIRGIKEKSHFSDTEYYTFYGVPYGQSTSKEMRFRDPIKVEPWDGVYDASTPKGGCTQFSLNYYKFTGTEDCLYSNINTPKLLSSNDESLLPVVVNIHPGGHIFSSPDPGDFGSADFVIHHNIVYVGIAYRLHILGFLNLDMKDCSGNQGLEDIIMGLHWLQENIRVFSGDPENITLMGSSSGCEIIHLLMLSPRAKGLFHKAVFMGMYAFNPTLYRRNANETAKTAFQIARGLGYRGSDKKQLLNFLKKIPAADMIAQMRMFKKRTQRFAEVFTSGPFYPTVDQGETAVLPASPIDLLSSMSRIPIIFGICEREAVIGFCGPYKTRIHKNLLTTYTQNEWGWGYHLNKDDVKMIAQKIQSFYSNGQPMENAPLAIKVDLQTDIGFSDVYETLIDVISAELPSSVYVYKFEFEGSILSTNARLLPLLDEHLNGTFHGTDYSYWGCMGGPSCIANLSIDDQTTKYVETFTKLICTFAKTGNPNYHGFQLQWNPSTLQNPCYLRIKNPLELANGKLNHERMEFWRNVKKELKELNK